MLADYSAACQRAADAAAAHRGARKAEQGAARGARHVKRDLITARATAQRRLKATVRSQQTPVVQQKVRAAFRTGSNGAAHAPRGGRRAQRTSRWLPPARISARVRGACDLARLRPLARVALAAAGGVGGWRLGQIRSKPFRGGVEDEPVGCTHGACSADLGRRPRARVRTRNRLLCPLTAQRPSGRESRVLPDDDIAHWASAIRRDWRVRLCSAAVEGPPSLLL